jgi:hypothetical protein
MATLFASRARTVWQAHTALRVVWGAAALLILTATYVRADGGVEGIPIVVDANFRPLTGAPCVTPYSAVYTTIGAAVSAAHSGAIIVVCPGNYAEQITINKSLTLQGVTNAAANKGAVVITVPPSGLSVSNGFYFANSFQVVAVQVLVQASNVNIIDVAVDGTGAFTGCSSPSLAGVGFDTGSSGTLRRVAVRNQNIPDGSGGYCGTNSNPPFGSGIVSQSLGSVTVQDSSVRGFTWSGFENTQQAPISIVIKTSVFVPINGAFAQQCVSVAGAFTLQFSNNTVTNCFLGLDLGSNPNITITGNTITNTLVGIACSGFCRVGNVSNNTIASNHTIAGNPSSGIGNFLGPSYWLGTTFQYNDISGTAYGISISGLGDTISYNTINDANVGIFGVTGNTVSNNTFLNVTTLTTQ